jgi:cation-transporting P-type ATPase E
MVATAAGSKGWSAARIVASLVAVFAAVLFIPALSDYFGLTGPGPAVLITVLPALVLWFAALTATVRLHLLDRALGLDQLRA